MTYHEQQLFTFDEAVRSSSNVRLQAHNIEWISETTGSTMPIQSGIKETKESGPHYDQIFELTPGESKGYSSKRVTTWSCEIALM